MDMTRACNSFTSDPGDILEPLHIGFSFVRYAVAGVILNRETQVLVLHLRQLLQGFFKLVSALSFCLLILISQKAIRAVCHKFDLLSSYLHFIPCTGFVETFDLDF